MWIKKLIVIIAIITSIISNCSVYSTPSNNCSGYSMWRKLNDTTYLFQFKYNLAVNSYIPQDTQYKIAIISPHGSQFNLTPINFYVNSHDLNLNVHPTKKGDGLTVVTIEYLLKLNDTSHKSLQLLNSDSFEVVLYMDDTHYLGKYNYSNSKIEPAYYIIRTKIFPTIYNSNLNLNISPHFNKTLFLRWLNPVHDATIFSPGVTETEGDSISFSLVPTALPKRTLQSINDLNALQDAWYSPFSYRLPVTSICGVPNKYDCKAFPNQYPPIGFFFDTQNGQIIFQSITDEHAPIHALCKEFRKINDTMKLIGTTEFIIEYTGNGIENNYFPRLQSKSYEYKICQKENLTIEISSTLNKRGDTTNLFWDSALVYLGAEWKVQNPNSRTKTVLLNWKPDSTHVRSEPYRFTAFVSPSNTAQLFSRTLKSPTQGILI